MIDKLCDIISIGEETRFKSNELNIILFFRANTSHDVWQFGVVIFVCLTGCLPWQKAALDDPRYVRYLSWQNTNIPLKRQPKLFKLVSSKAQRLFKKYLEPRIEKRPNGLSEVQRYLDDRWMSKGMEKIGETQKEDEGLCPSMYSFHSSPEEKNKLLFSLTQYGLETTVDRVAKKDRIREWIQNSVIEEDDEHIEEGDEENIKIRDNENGPIGERDANRGPVSESRVKRRERRMSTLKKIDDIYRPPVDPRIPLEHQKKTVVAEPSTTSRVAMANGNSTAKYDISKQLPFQNVKISNSLHSSESTFSSDSSTVVRQQMNTNSQNMVIESNSRLIKNYTKFKR